MADCKKTIADCLYSDALPDRPLQFAKAKKVVADFCKAVADPVPHADLMLFFVEQGNSFSVEYGDIDSGFYAALLTMGRSAVQVIGRLPYVV